MKELAKRKTIGLLIDRVQDSFQKMYWTGIESVVRKKNANLILFVGGSIGPERAAALPENSVYRLVNRHRLDGIIIAAGNIGHLVSQKRTAEFCRAFQNIPAVGLGTPVPGIPSVCSENKIAMLDLMHHLISVHGCRKIAFVRGPKRHPHDIARFETYAAALDEFQIPYSDDLVIQSNSFLATEGYAAARRLLARGEPVCQAVVASNDNLALGIIQYLYEHGIHVPRDLIVTGYDDIEEGRRSLPSLTTVDQHSEMQGTKAAEALFALIEGGETTADVLIPGTMKIRQSCGCFGEEIYNAAVSRVYLDIVARKLEPAERIETVMKDVVRVFRPQGQRLKGGKELTRRFVRIVEAFFTDLTGSPPGDFLQLLESLLHEQALTTEDVARWKDFVSLLRQHLLFQHDELDTIIRGENLLHQARLLMSDIANRVLAFRQSASDRLMDEFDSIGQDLMSTFQVETLMQILERHVQSLRIRHCYIVLQEQNSPGVGKLIFACRRTGRIRLPDEGVYFPQAQLVPDKFFSWNEHCRISVRPLAVKEKHLGYLILSAEQSIERLCEELRNRLSSALMGSLLFQTVNEQVENIEAQVDARTEQLTKTNQRLQSEIETRKKMALELSASEKRYRTFFEDDLTGDFIADLKYNIADCNPAFARIFGLSGVATAKTLNLERLFPNRQSFESTINALLQQKQLEYYELELVRPDGTPVYIVANLGLVQDDNGETTHFRGYLFDNTPRKYLEEQLRESQKMEALGRLAGGIAHDFNNLLTAINGYSELILTELDPGNPIADEIGEIIHAGDKAAALTNQLLAFSRRQVLQPQILDLNIVVADMEKLLRRLISAEIRFQTVLTPNIGAIRADRSQLEQVVMNLVLNARDAMDSGGELVVRTGAVSLDVTTYTSDDLLLPGEYVTLAITDNGTGISDEIRHRIFEPFYTTKEQGKGTGLGLAMVYGIIQQSGGYLKVESIEGEGSAFTIFLPRYNVPYKDLEVREIVRDRETVHGAETILIVEDEKQVRTIASRILTQNGYKVYTAENGEVALDLFLQKNGAIDLIVTDVVMPVMNGTQLYLTIKKEFPDIKVLFMSGYTDDQVLRHGVIEKETPFIAKPFSSESFLHKVREVLDG